MGRGVRLVWRAGCGSDGHTAPGHSTPWAQGGRAYTGQCRLTPPTCHPPLPPRYYDGVAVGAVPSLNGTIPPAWENATGWYSIDANAYPHTPFDQPFYLLLNMALGGS